VERGEGGFRESALWLDGVHAIPGLKIETWGTPAICGDLDVGYPPVGNEVQRVQGTMGMGDYWMGC
jgi:hypothetical protein